MRKSIVAICLWLKKFYSGRRHFILSGNYGTTISAVFTIDNRYRSTNGDVQSISGRKYGNWQRKHLYLRLMRSFLVSYCVPMVTAEVLLILLVPLKKVNCCFYFWIEWNVDDHYKTSLTKGKWQRSTSAWVIFDDVFAPTPIVSSVYSLFLWIFVFSTPQPIRKTIAVNFKECVGKKYENINSIVQKSIFVVKARPL